MVSQRPSKWSAFLLSLAVPGTGQLLAGSTTALGWFVAAALATALLTPLQSGSLSAWTYCLSLPLWVAFSVSSAWHARGLLESQPPWPASKCSKSKLACHLAANRTVRATLTIPTTLTPAELWRRVSDLENFLTIDPFHERITLMRSQPAEGVDVVLHHNAFGKQFNRYGRILRWREGEAFSISDLSAVNPQNGFPHVFTYDVRELSDGTSELHVAITGRWTSRLIPILVGRWWIRMICQYHATLLASTL